jgi:heterodisulfide reductase subunit A
MKDTSKIGSVLVVGGGIAGVQASLDLADSGYFVYLLERSASIGGGMAQLDKTFPTNDCSMCILSPKLVECGRHLNIEILTLAQVQEITGEAGSFRVKVIQNPRYVDIKRCIACGICAQKCPKKVKDEFNMGIGMRKAAYIPYPQAVPLKYVIDPANCIWIKRPGRCGACKIHCPADAVDFDQKTKEFVLPVGSIILSPGFECSLPEMYQYHNFPNAITGMEFERILSASGPYQGHLLRPSDQKEPKSIAWLQCVGSRDIKTPYCSAVCCMYAIKEAIIAKEHSKQPLDAAIFFMDMRTPGKGFERYYRRAKDELNVRFVRSRVYSLEPIHGTDNLMVRYTTDDGRTHQEAFGMVVLSTGLKPPKGAVRLAQKAGINLDNHNFVENSSFTPVNTSISGIYVCGACNGPKDIPQSVMEASAAVCASSLTLAEVRHTLIKEMAYPPERDVSYEEPRIGVFVCNCGINIGGVVDVPEVRDYAKGLPHVVYVEDNLFTCSQDTQERMKEAIKENHLNRVVVASCSPRTHEPLFQETLKKSGLNKYLFEMANIRDQDSWVHMNQPEKATEKAKDLVRMAAARAALLEPLEEVKQKPIPAGLIIGGGVAGMVSALSLADQGYKVYLIEKTGKLGGYALKLRKTWRGEDVGSYVNQLARKVSQHNLIDIFFNSEVKDTIGYVGNFKTTIAAFGSGTKAQVIEHGVTIIATGAHLLKPDEYIYGKNENVFVWHDLYDKIEQDTEYIKNAKTSVFILCVGSREPGRPYCSKICCTSALANALELKKLNPDMEVYVLYRDIRTYGTREDLYTEARNKGIIFIRYDLDLKPEVQEETDIHGNKRLKVTVMDKLLQEAITIYPDLITLQTAIIPGDHENLARLFKVPINEDKFFLEAHMKLRPVDFATEGIYVAGLAHYPKPIDETIAQAQAAAARAVTVLAKDYIKTGGIVCQVDDALCRGCGQCVEACMYSAIELIESRPGIQTAIVKEAICRGCGACAAVCPTGAANIRHFADDEVLAMVESAFRRQE